MADKNTENSTSGPSNPMVDTTLTNLLSGLNNEYGKASAAGVNSTLNRGWEGRLGAANNPDYARGIAGGTSELADIAAGKRFGMDDPGYAAMRQGVLDDVVTGVNSASLIDGRFGSSVHGDALGRAATRELAGLDYGNFLNDQSRQFQAISALPGQFGAAQAPGDVWTSVGQEKAQQPWMALGNASSILAGSAGASGTSQTTPTAPWWQQMLGAGALGAGIYGNLR